MPVCRYDKFGKVYFAGTVGVELSHDVVDEVFRDGSVELPVCL